MGYEGLIGCGTGFWELGRESCVTGRWSSRPRCRRLWQVRTVVWEKRVGASGLGGYMQQHSEPEAERMQGKVSL